MMSEHARMVPIFWGHGTHDPLIRYELALASIQFLTKEAGIKEASKEDAVGLEFHSYKGLVHSASNPEINELGVWLKRVIPETE